MVPTMNRSDFIDRLLAYYADTGFKHWISIGDSSDQFHVDQTKRSIRKFKDKLKIIYNEYPGLDCYDCLREIIKTISSPFAVLLPDDDFLVPNGLEKCIKFLEHHPDFASVHGKAVMLVLKATGPYGEINKVWDYNLPILGQNRASDRIKQHLASYKVSLFCVHKTESWRMMYKRLDIPDKSFKLEIIPSCLSAVLGKAAQIDGLYLVRHVHDRRYCLPDMFDWLTDKNWHSSYKVFDRVLAEEISLNDGIPISEAHQILKQAFWSYLGKHMKLNWQQCYVDEDSFKSKLKKLPMVDNFFLPIFRTIKKLRYAYFPSRTITLEGILKPTHSYYKDFMPVYKSITKHEYEV